jgi:cardiolipin synthase
MHSFAIPNALTVFRVLLIPLVLYLLVNSPEHPRYRLYALIILIVQQASDILDGFLARRIKRDVSPSNRFGEVMDPLADKLFIVSTYIALSHALGFPWWATLTFLAKELLLLISWALRIWLFGIRMVRPNFVGKAAGTCQALLILGFLLGMSGVPLKLGIGVTVVLTALAGIIYLITGVREALRSRDG